MAPHSEKMKLMRIVVREDFTKSRCDALIQDIKLALQVLDEMDHRKIKEHKEHMTHMRRRSTLVGQIKKMPTNHFADEKHSLQGKSGKTHGVC
jgi:glutamate decarboxylase